MSLEKLLHRFARVIPGPILDHDDMLFRLRKDIKQKCRIALRVEATPRRFVKELTREILNEANELVAFAFATRWHLGLLTFGCPGITQRAPLGKTGLIAKEQQGLFLPRLPPYLGPPRLTPFETFGLVKMIRDKAGFLVRKPHIL